MGLVLTSIFIIGFIILVKYLISLITLRFKKGAIPGPIPIPIFGNCLEFMNIGSVAIYEKLLDYGKIYGDVYRLDLGFKVWIVISDADVIETITTSDKFLTKSIDYDLLYDWLGDGLITSTGSKWATHRKALTSAFHFKILEQFFSIMEAHGDILIERIANLTENDVEFDIFNILALFTMDVICETSMGASLEAQSGGSQYAKSVEKATAIYFWRIFHPLAWHETIFKMFDKYKTFQENVKFIHTFDYNVINKKRQQLRNEEMCSDDDENFGIKKKEALLDLLLKVEIDGKKLTDEEIREEVDNFMFAGQDTTATALTFILYILAKFPEVQKKVCEEIENVFADKDVALVKKINELKYMELVIKETMRLFPPVPLIVRKVCEDYNFGNYIIRKGEEAVIAIHILHRNPKYFSQPEKFIPERFDRETNTEKFNPFAYIPFSAGQRNCIGQKYAMYEIKITIVKILQNFSVALKDENYEVVMKPEVVLKTVDPIPLVFKKINK